MNAKIMYSRYGCPVVCGIALVFLCTGCRNPHDMHIDEPNPFISFVSITSNGTFNTAPTVITLVFSEDIPDLEAEDLVLSGPGTGVAKGTLTAAGNGRYTLAVSGITVSGNLYITVIKDGLDIQPATRGVPVYAAYWDTVDPNDLPQSDPPPFAGQTEMNTIIGKAIGGLMAWHQTTDWREWSRQLNRLPGPGNVHVDMWPAGWEDYRANGATLYNTDFTMPDGRTAQLFNSHDAEHILTHYQWIREMDVDGSGILRFFSRIPRPIVDTGHQANQYTRHRDAAEVTGRFFFIQYDATGTHGIPQSDIIRDLQHEWVYNVERKGIVSSPNYAHADGKPVVSIWGVYGMDYNRYTSIDTWIELIQWFRDRGYYVLGGTPDDRFWETGGSRHPRSHEVFSMLDGISPWYVGRDIVGNVLGTGNNQQWLIRGMEFCRTNLRSWADNKPIDFMPTIWPGFAWVNMGLVIGVPNERPRNAGQFIWNQVREYLGRDTHHNISSLYLVMLDEYGEATASFKTAVDYFDIPLHQYFLTLATDGTWLSSDYYMRLTSAFVQAFKTRGSGAFDIGPLNDYDNTDSVIVEHSLGPVLWRNSFERRNGQLVTSTGVIVPVNHVQVDVGVPDGEVMGNTRNVTVGEVFTVNRPHLPMFAVNDSYRPPSGSLGMVYTNSARSGDSAFRLAGLRTAGTGALYRYKIANTRIKIDSGMKLSYWINAAGLGENVIVDLQMDNGAHVSVSVTAQNTGSAHRGWQQRTLTIPDSLIGRYITAVIVAYMDNESAAGTSGFAAIIDDIVIDR